MDTDIYNQLQSLPSTQSTAADLSQDFSPLRQKHKDSILFPFSCGSSQNINNSQEDTSKEPAKKAIFKIIRENKSTHSQTITVPLHKDFGNYNRKEKSLGELSKRLLMMFGRVDHCVISLDAVTNQLGVERRRIYDIINILESLGVVFRKGKNSYQWKGLRSIYDTINKLQHENLDKSSSSTQMALEFDSQVKVEESDDEDEDDDGENSNGFEKDLSGAKREKSLGLLSTGFIKLFFSWKGTISLEQAGRKMSTENIEENKIKTKIRRLYDIANVFSSLGLIKKTCLESKKPAYAWIGLSGLDSFIQRLTNCTDEKEIFIEPVSNKPKEQPRVITEKKPLEKQPIQIQANKAISKIENFQPILNNDTLETLLCTLLNLYKMQQPHTSSQEDLLSALQNKSSLFQTPKMVKQASSPALVTPSIKRSVSILQRADSDSGLSSEKQKQTSKGFSLYGKNEEVTNGKRNASQVLDTYEKATTLKRLHSFDDYETSKHTATKSLNFLNNENCHTSSNLESHL